MKNLVKTLRIVRRPFLLIAVLASCSITAFGQTTAFAYQGKLADGGMPSNGNYDFEFKLFDTSAVGTGAQLGSTLQRLNFGVTNGIFTVSLDFGVCASCFNGAARFLEISLKPTGGGAFTILGPRQQIASTPYALKSVNATTSDGLSVTCVSCVTSGQIQSVAGSQVSGAIPVASLPAGSGSYVQNTLSLQAGSNFNISGDGTAGGTLSADVVNATMRYEMNGTRVLSTAGTNNLFAGFGAGVANTTGTNNSFFGSLAGFNNNGFRNTFFGQRAGESNATGSDNTVVGSQADVGANNLTNATAIGSRAFVGQTNSLVLGSINGVNSSTADTSVGIGTTAPAARFHLIGKSSAATTPVAIFQSAGSQVPLALKSGGSEVARIRADSQGNLVLATLNGTDKDIYFRAGHDSAGADMFIQSSSGNVGIGTTSPTNRLTVGQPDIAGGPVVGVYGAGLADIIVRDTTDNVSGVFSANGDRLVVGTVTNHEVQFRTNNVTRMTISPAGFIGITAFGAAGSAFVCFNNLQEITICGSSIRYKSNVRDFHSGLDLIRRLRPVSFNWKDGGMLDMGLVAEEVAEVEPLLVTHNKKGEIEGVKYDRVGVVLINAVNEQQAQIERQQKRIEEQQMEIDALKTLVRSKNLGQGKSVLSFRVDSDDASSQIGAKRQGASTSCSPTHYVRKRGVPRRSIPLKIPRKK